MTSLEMQERFLILYDKITNFDAPGYEDEEISILLTKAQERVFLSYYNIKGNRFLEGFELTEARRKELNNLVTNLDFSISVNQNGVLPNGVFYDIPENCLFVISEEVTFNSDNPCFNGLRARVKPMTHDQYSINIKNPFKKPSVDFVWRLDFENKHEIILPQNVTISKYQVRYLRRLNPIITGNFEIEGQQGPLNCELDRILHERVIDEAVKIATAVTEPQLYQIKSAEQKEGE